MDMAPRRGQRPADIVAHLAQLEAQSVDVLGAVLSLDGDAADAEARDANLVDDDAGDRGDAAIQGADVLGPAVDGRPSHPGLPRLTPGGVLTAQPGEAAATLSSESRRAGTCVVGTVRLGG